MAFNMEEVLLEPFGGEILQLSVGSTTTLTATLATGALSGFALASVVLGRGYDPFRMASIGAWVGIPAFLAVIASASMQSTLLFALGTGLIGLGSGLFGHGTLTATMQAAPPHQTGLSLGTWGAVQATAAGLAIALAVAHGFLKKNFLHMLLGTQLQLPHAVWNRLNLSWMLYCVFMAAINAYVAHYFSTEDWVNFKLWGYVFPVVFILGQGLYISRYLPKDEGDQK